MNQMMSDKVILVISGGGYFIGVMLDLPFFIDTAISSLLYYSLGVWFFKSGFFQKKMSMILTALFGLGYFLACYLLHPYVSLKDNEYPIYLVVIASIATLSLYQICNLLGEKENILVRFLVKCGKSSLTMLGFNAPILLLVYPLCLVLHLSTPATITLEMVACVIISLIVDSVLTRYAPVLLGKKK